MNSYDTSCYSFSFISKVVQFLHEQQVCCQQRNNFHSTGSVSGLRDLGKADVASGGHRIAFLLLILALFSSIHTLHADIAYPQEETNYYYLTYKTRPHNIFEACLRKCQQRQHFCGLRYSGQASYKNQPKRIILQLSASFYFTLQSYRYSSPESAGPKQEITF